ncbi:MAG: diguanylate cyclase [Deltaproteobacteria bacterium]|jgi:GGDEF domain-containing protein|nr:diguanylate cyclase [Deltaproteobacteria bacterium]
MSPKSVKQAANSGPGRITSAVQTATCVDLASGLYHRQHFQLSLDYEFNRMVRTEKPLGLIVVRLPAENDQNIKPMASFLKNALRPLDLAAKLSDREIVILIPEADRDRALRLLSALAEEFGDGGQENTSLSYSGALARPYEDWTPETLLSRARDGFDSASAVTRRMLSAAGPWTEVSTALASAEKDSLFDGFSSLAHSGSNTARPGRR